MAILLESQSVEGCCGACQAQLAEDQRYCVNCGTAVSDRLTWPLTDTPDAPAPAAAAGQTSGRPPMTARRLRLFPGSDVALPLAFAVFSFVLGLGAWAGARTTSGGGQAAPIAVAAAPAPAAAPAAPTLSGLGPADDGAGFVADDAAPAASDVLSSTDSGAVAADVAAGDDSSGDGAGSSEPENTTNEAPADNPKQSAPVTVPALKHVWVVVLTDQGYNTLFDPAGEAPYLAKDLAAKGTVLTQYHGTAPSSLANGVALVSGQGPNAATQANCPAVTDVTPGDVGSDDQAAGTGCLYSSNVFTIGDLLTSKKKTWRAYAGDLDGKDGCPKPELGAAFGLPRVPFLAFRTITDDAACATRITGLDQLSGDLATADRTPTLSYIVPGRCEDGSSTPCEAGKPAGLRPVDAMLRRVVDPIMASAAYADKGAIVIVADQAPQGPDGDKRSCCGKRPWQKAAVDGGGRTGALVLSPLVARGATRDASVDHYDLLKTVSQLVGVRPPGYAGRDEVKGLPVDLWSRGD